MKETQGGTALQKDRGRHICMEKDSRRMRSHRNMNASCTHEEVHTHTHAHTSHSHTWGS